MGDELYFVDPAEEAGRYLARIEEALAAEGEAVRTHLQEAISSGQSLLDTLDDSLSETDDMDLAEQLEQAIHHLGLSLDLGEQALEYPAEEMESGLLEMRRQASQAVALVRQAA